MAAAQASAPEPSEEVRRQLRSSFQALSDLGFNAEGAAAVERALPVVSALATAANRAHFEYTRWSRPGTEAAAAGLGGGPGAASGAHFEADFLAVSLDGLEWDPKPVLMFLHQLKQAAPIHRNRLQKTATVLTQISPTYREAVKADQFLARWLGACRSKSDPADAVSYGFASSLRFAAWHAAGHWVGRRRGAEADAEAHSQSWSSRKQALLQTSELPEAAVSTLLDAVWEAAEHCATNRWPEASSMMSAVKNFFVPQEDAGPHKDEFFALFERLEASGELAGDLLGDLRWMIWNVCWHVANKSKGFAKDALEALVRCERHLQRAFRTTSQWRGVNLGGWFLLEPGPCTDFWKDLPEEARSEECEWGACAALGPEEASRRLQAHRRTYFSKEDFAAMRAAGLTHVRLCYGAWCVAGPRAGEPYVGPCLEQLDQAVNLCEAAGMNVLLDLHGTPGGETDGPPCGHKDSSWTHQRWSAEESLAVLRTVAERYADRTCICGMGVMNEPAESHPAKTLAKYYEDAVHVIRSAGMRAGEVAVLLPIFTEGRVGELMALWEGNFAVYEDVVFDVHFYQCFGTLWNLLSLEAHMKAAAQRRDTLSLLPTCCVSEWSLALPSGTLQGDDTAKEETLRRFADIQLKAYETATHGWFFWTWKDSAGVEWNLQECLRRGIIQVPRGGRDSDLVTP